MDRLRSLLYAVFEGGCGHVLQYHRGVRRQRVGVGSLALWTLTVVFRLPDLVAFTCQAISTT